MSLNLSRYRFSLLATGALLLLLNACKKEKSSAEVTPQEEQAMAFTSARSDAQSHFTFDDVFDNVLGVNAEVGFGNTGVFGRVGGAQNVDSVPSCVQLTVTRLNPQAPFPVRITVDFGAGCTARDGRTRYGKIITEYTKRLLEPDAVATTTFDHYRIDSIQIEGTHITRNTSSGNRRQFSVEIRDARISRPSGDYSLWSAERTITQVEGMNTPNLAIDDIFAITGNGAGQSRRDNLIHRWTSSIETPLRKRFNCRWISAGTVRTARVGLAANSPWVGLLNYGQGICDNLASFSINNSTYQISLP